MNRKRTEQKNTNWFAMMILFCYGLICIETMSYLDHLITGKYNVLIKCN